MSERFKLIKLVSSNIRVKMFCDYYIQKDRSFLGNLCDLYENDIKFF